MRLTLLLLRRNYMPNGNIFTGKHRLVRDVLPEHLKRLKGEFKIEERNMLYLKHPYLTEEESHGHSKALKKRANTLKFYADTSMMKFKRKNFTHEDILLHLNTTYAWE